MAKTTITKILFRRGSDFDRTPTVLDEGEPGWCTDTCRLFIGNGNRPGGFPAVNIRTPLLAPSHPHNNDLIYEPIADVTGVANPATQHVLALNHQGLSGSLTTWMDKRYIASAPDNPTPAVFYSDTTFNKYVTFGDTVDLCNAVVKANTITPCDERVSFSGSSIKLPVGDAAARPTTPLAGDMRFNTDAGSFEGYDGAAWGSVADSDVTVINTNITEVDDRLTSQVASVSACCDANTATLATGITYYDYDYITIPWGSTTSTESASGGEGSSPGDPQDEHRHFEKSTTRQILNSRKKFESGILTEVIHGPAEFFRFANQSAGASGWVSIGASSTGNHFAPLWDYSTVSGNYYQQNTTGNTATTIHVGPIFITDSVVGQEGVWYYAVGPSEWVYCAGAAVGPDPSPGSGRGWWSWSPNVGWHWSTAEIWPSVYIHTPLSGGDLHPITNEEQPAGWGMFWVTGGQQSDYLYLYETNQVNPNARWVDWTETDALDVNYANNPPTPAGVVLSPAPEDDAGPAPAVATVALPT